MVLTILASDDVPEALDRSDLAVGYDASTA